MRRLAAAGAYLIKDRLQFFAPQRVLDPMTGSGTCRDVCADLGVACTSFDLRAGQDASDRALVLVSQLGVSRPLTVWPSKATPARPSKATRPFLIGRRTGLC